MLLSIFGIVFCSNFSLLNDPGRSAIVLRELRAQRSNLLEIQDIRNQRFDCEIAKQIEQCAHLCDTFSQRIQSGKQQFEERFQRSGMQAVFCREKTQAAADMIRNQQEKLANAVKNPASSDELIINLTMWKRQNHEAFLAFDRYWTKRAIADGFLSDETNIGKDTYHKRIGLAIDGGGMRGIIPALILAEIERITKKSIYQLFDFVGGTSVGGILALGLITPQPNTGISGEPFSARDLVNLFEEHGTTLFPYTSFKGVRQFFTNIYPAAGLKNTLTGYFGDYTLLDVKKPCVITAITSQKRPFKFQSEKAHLDMAHNFFLKDVATATASAPTYFPTVKIWDIRGKDEGKEYQLSDGGVWRNNPSRLVHEAMLRLYDDIPLSKTAVVSIGTGENPPSLLPSHAGISDGASIFSATTHADSTSINEEMTELLGKSFYRLQPQLDMKIELDETRPVYLDFLKACAEEQYPQVEEVARILLQNFDLKRLSSI